MLYVKLYTCSYILSTAILVSQNYFSNLQIQMQTEVWLVDRKLVEDPSNFIAGCPKAALL